MLAELPALPFPTTLTQELSFAKQGRADTEVNVARQTLTDEGGTSMQ